MRLHAHAQRVFLFIVAKTSPGRRILREDNRPLLLVRNRVQAVRARRQRLSFHRHIVRKSNGGVLIRSGAPHLPIRNCFAPNLAAAHHRPVIVNGDIRQPNALRDAPALADTRNIQFRRLAAIFELRFRAAGKKEYSCEKA